MKITTWNVNSLNVRLPHVLDWLQVNHPNILALQETKLIDEKFPEQAFTELGYQAIYSGQKTYNGVAIIAKQNAQDVMTDITDLSDPQRRILVASYGDIRVINLYVPNGFSLDSDKYYYKLNWLEKVSHFIHEQLVMHPKLIVLGDFNIAPEDRDVHNPEQWQGSVLVSQEERAAWQHLLSLGLQDTFRLFEQAEKSYSWWDYRMLAFRRNHGLRIDHILTSQMLADQCQRVIIDKEERKKERPSDHAPVTAEFQL